MSDIVPGTHVRMRVTRRFGPYNVGELIAVGFWEGRELEAKRLAQPLDLLVPVVATPAGQESATEAPVRRPAEMVRK